MKIIFVFLLTALSLLSFSQMPPIGSGVFHFDQMKAIPGHPDQKNMVMGSTNELSTLMVSVVSQPKTAISNTLPMMDAERLIIVKQGKMKCIVGAKESKLDAGSVVLVPPSQRNVIINISADTLVYYVFLYTSKKPVNILRSDSAGGAIMINADTVKITPSEKGGTKKYFNRPTALTDNYEMHVTYLNKKGPGHAPHQHLETEAILVIDGEVQMTIDGKEYKGANGDLFIVESGKMHGVANASDKPCSYFAFKWR